MKRYITPSIETIIIEDTDLICTSSKTTKISVSEPYHTISSEQRFALMYLLCYFSKFANVVIFDDLKATNPDAESYLKKAENALGVASSSISVDLNNNSELETYLSIIKTIQNKQIIDYMVNNTYNLVILAREDDFEPAHITYQKVWNSLGYTREERHMITQKYMYRSQI